LGGPWEGELEVKKTAADEFKYLACDGGPHLLLPVALAPLWRGVDPTVENVLDPAPDYGRACAVPPPIGAINVGAGEGLVLGESPPISAWAPSLESGGVDLFVLQEWSDTELDSLLLRAREIHSTALHDTRTWWCLQDGGAYLMFAGDTVDAPVYELLHVPLRKGRYVVKAGQLDDNEGVVEVFRLVPVEQGA
jgi:hypothetical protein